MKKFRKIMAVLVAAMMIMAMCVPMMSTKVWAADNPGTPTYTYTQVASGATYDPAKEYYVDQAGNKYTGGESGFATALTGAGLYTREANQRIIIKSKAVGTETAENATVYTWYKLMNAEIGANGLTTVSQDTGLLSGDPKSPVAYYVESETLANALAGTGSLFKKTAAPSANPPRWYISLVDAETPASNIADALAANTTAQANAINWSTATANGTDDIVIEAPGPGYYLIVASNGIVRAVQTLGVVTIDEKNTFPTLTKFITAENGTVLATPTATDDIDMGVEVTFTLTVTVPETVETKAITLKDTLSAGFTYTADSAEAKYNSGNSTATITTTQSGTALTFEIDAASVRAAKGDNIVLTYKAKLDKDAVLRTTTNDAGNPNEVYLEYDEYKSVTKSTITYTHTFSIKKMTTATGNAPLPGVEFKLTRKDDTAHNYQPHTGVESVWDSNGTTTVTTNSNGEYTFDGLAAGEYILTEVTPVAGYHMLSAPVNVKIESTGAVKYTCADTSAGDSNTTSGEATAENEKINIYNTPGTQLPATGGMGTTVLYIVGGMLVILAGAYLFFSRKRTA